MSRHLRPKLTPHGRVRRGYWTRQLQHLPSPLPMAGGSTDTWLDEYHRSAPADAPEITDAEWQALQDQMLADAEPEVCAPCLRGEHTACRASWMVGHTRWYCQCSCQDEGD